jgi:hypothetical protein
VVAAGAATLFAELAVIRYVPGQVRILGYFTNLVLLAAFLGFGVGMLGARRPGAPRLGRWAPFALLAVVASAWLGSRLHVLPSPSDFLFVEHDTAGRWISLPVFLSAAFVALAAAWSG